MSNVNGIADLTRNLSKFLRDGGVRDVVLDLRLNPDADTTTLYLYKTEIDSHYRNHQAGYEFSESKAPLPLRLSYLLIFNHSDQQNAQLRLARALQLLQRSPILPKEFAEQGNGKLTSQADPIRLALDDLSLEDLTKLWTSFQTRYRLTMPFTASVLMLDIEAKSPDPLPILTPPKPPENIVVLPNLATKILSAYGLPGDPEIKLQPKLANVSVGKYMVFEVSGAVSEIKAFEFVPMSESLPDNEKQRRTIRIEKASFENKKIGNTIRVKLDENLKLDGDPKWLNDTYQVRGILPNPFSNGAGGKPDVSTNPITISVVPSPKLQNGKFATITNGLMSVELLNSLRTDGTTDETRKVTQNPVAILTQWKPKGEPWEGKTPRRFEFRAVVKPNKPNSMKFGLNGHGDTHILYDPDEEYVLRIKIGDAVSQHYDLDKDHHKETGEWRLKIDESAIIKPAGDGQ